MKTILSVITVTSILSVGVVRPAVAQSCSFTASPTTVNTGPLGTAGVITLTASDASCAWTASASDAWLDVVPVKGAYANVVLADQPRGYWRLNEAQSATTAGDASGHGHPATYTGTVSLGTSNGLADGSTAATLNGSDSIAIADGPVWTPNALAWNTASSSSVEIWLNVANTRGSYQTVFLKGTYATAPISVYIDPNDTHLEVDWLRTTGQHSYIVTQAPVVGQGWTHVVLTFTSTTYAFYVNGALDRSGSLLTHLPTNLDSIVVGTSADGSLYGSVSDVAIYNTALTASQVSAHYAARTTSGSSGSGAVSYRIAANGTTSSRNATATMGGESVAISQSGLPVCTYTVDPSQASAAASGGAGIATVSASDPLCTWTASSNQSWTTLAPVTGGYATAVLNSTPLGYWRMNEASGATNAADASGHGHQGSYLGAVSPGVPNGLSDSSTGVGVNGTGRVQVSDGPPWATSSPIGWTTSSAATLEAWVNMPYVYGQYQVLFMKGGWDPSPVLVYFLPYTDEPIVYWYGADGQHRYRILNTGIADTGWAHLVFTFTATSYTFYVNGALDSTGSLPAPLVTNTLPITVATDEESAPFHGQFSDVSIYNRVLTATEVADHYAQRTAIGSSGSGAVSYTVTANPTTSTRNATLTIAAQTVSVSQAGLPNCTFTVSPTSVSSPVAGSAGVIDVTASDAACGWTATSNQSWATVAPLAGGYATAVMGDQPAGYWRLNEASGTTVADASGHGRTGTYDGTVTHGLTNGMNDGSTAVAVNGAGQIQVPHDIVWNATSFTLETWVNVPEVSSGYRTLIAKGTWPLAPVLVYFVNGPAQTQVYWRGTDGQNRYRILSAPVQVQGWTHLALTFTPTSYAFYVNGALDTFGDLPAPLVTNTAAWTFGAGDGYWMRGQLSDVAFYPTALSATQINNHYAQRATIGASGSGHVSLTVAENTTTSPRSATLTVASQSVAVAQATTCSYSASPSTITSGPNGTTGSITIATQAGCAWTTSSTQSWATLGASSGTGPGTVSYAIAANAAAARTAFFTVAGSTISVSQEAVCVVTVTTSDQTTGAIAPALAGGVAGALGVFENLPTIQNLTIAGWWHVPSYPSSAPIMPNFFFIGNDDNQWTHPYIWAGFESQSGSRRLQFEFYDGNDWTDLASTETADAQWIHVAYVKEGNQHRLYLSDGSHDASLVLSTTQDTSGITPEALLFFTDLFDGVRTSIGGLKIWQAALTAEEIRAERTAGYQVARTQNLYLNAPLSSPEALSDISGNAHHLVIDQAEYAVFETVAGPVSHIHPDGQGSVATFDVAASSSNCRTTISTSATWVTPSAASVSGSATVTVTVAENQTATSRVATVTVGSNAYVIAQDVGCVASVLPFAITAPREGSTGFIAVAPNRPGCTWTTSADQSWITLDDRLDAEHWEFYVGRILADRPAVYFDFEHPDGLVVPGVFVGPSATLQPGATIVDGELTLDGTHGEMIVEPSTGLTLTNGLTITLNVHTTADEGQILGSVADTWSMHLVDGYIELRLLNVAIRSDRVINDGWSHLVVATWNGSRVDLYVDGQRSGHGSVAGVLGASTSGLLIGGALDQTDLFEGGLDNIVVLDHGYTADEVRARVNWDSGRWTTGSAVVPYMIDPTGTGNARTAVLAIAASTVNVSQAVGALTITNASPSAGAFGTEVTVTGTGFGTVQGTGSLFLGNKPGTIVSWSDTQIVATVALGAMSGTIQVRQNGAVSNGISFSVAVPTITNTSISGSQVTITGTGFGATQGAGQVWIGTAAGTIVSWSDTQIVATAAADANAGNIQVLQHGVFGNSMPYTINNTPHIDSISPSTATVGTSVTVYGKGFGTSQGTSTVSVAGVTASVSSWSDTQLAVTVPSGALTGVLKVQRNGIWSNRIGLRVPPVSGTAITLSPNAIVLTVGQARTLQAFDANGSLVTGLTWTSTDTAVASLSADDPPVITALAPGNVTIKAGSGSADLTIYNAGALPVGTTLWSVPGSAGGVAEIKIAVPNYDAVADAFAIGNDYTVQAITSDGTVAWTAASPLNFSLFVPDFQGGLLAHNFESIYRLDPLTGASTSLYTNANDETLSWGLAAPAIHTDGTVFTIDYTCNDSCGGEDPEEGAWVVGLNSVTGEQKFRVKMKNWTFTSYEPNADFCAPGLPSADVYHDHPWPNNAIKIAGDGYAYLSYFTIDYTSSDRKSPVQPFSDDAYAAMRQLRNHVGVDWTVARADLDAVWAATGWSHSQWNYQPLLSFWGNLTAVQNLLTPASTMLTPLCDTTGTDVWQMHMMRVGSDGSSSDVVAKEWRNNFSRTHSVTAEYPFWHETRLNSYMSPDGTLPDNPLRLDFSENIITDADRGALFSWQAMDKYGRGEPENHLTLVHDGAIASDVVWTVGESFGAVRPILQLEDGVFAGERTTSLGTGIVVFNSAGDLRWTQQALSPVIATAGGGLIAVEGSTYVQFDGTGVATAQLRSIPSQWSWFGRGYNLGSVEQVIAADVTVAPTFGALLQGSASGNGTAIQQVSSNTATGSEEQLPPTGSELRTNHNSIELLTTRTPEQIFDDYLATFAGVKLATNTVAYVSSPTTPVSSTCQKLTFHLTGLAQYGQEPFSVGVTQFDRATQTISAITLKGHPLGGWRYWRAFSIGPNDVVVETGAMDAPAAGLKNFAGFYTLRGAQIRVWEDDLRYILSTLRNAGLAQQGTNPAFNFVKGRWNVPQSPLLSHIVLHLPPICGQ